MKKLLMVLGGIFVAVILIFIVLAIAFLPRLYRLNKLGEDYIQKVVPQIVDHWNPTNLLACATPELAGILRTNNKTGSLFQMFSQLGSLTHLKEPVGTVYSGSSTTDGSYTIGNFNVDGDFEKGTARIHIQLLLVGQDWKINSFRINSDVFLPKADNRQNSSDPAAQNSSSQVRTN